MPEETHICCLLGAADLNCPWPFSEMERFHFMLSQSVFRHLLGEQPLPELWGLIGNNHSSREPKMMEFPVGLIFVVFKAESGWCDVRWAIKYFLEREMGFQKSKERLGGGAGPMAKWLSCCAPHRWPRISPVRILSMDMAPLIRPCWGSIPHATTRRTHNWKIYSCEPGALWGEKVKIKSLKRKSIDT